MDIERGTMSISQYMARYGMEGGVGLDDSEGEETVSAILGEKGGRKYQVGSMVARGGMGAILEAKDLNIRRRVAMKIMLAGKGAPKDRILRFIEEAQVTGQLEHPSIAPVHELGVDAHDNVFYTMKYVQGINLKDILQGIIDGKPEIVERYPLKHLLRVFLKACDAVAFAHTKGVVHRDLKPENIMVGEFGAVLVMDWGLAKVLRSGEPGTENGEPLDAEDGGDGGAEESAAPGTGNAGTGPEDAAEAGDGGAERMGAGLGIESVRSDGDGEGFVTVDGLIMGTPAFMAPEQAHGKIDELDERTDVYALGAILYNILTLRPPVGGDSTDRILRNVVTGNIAQPTIYNQPGTTSAKTILLHEPLAEDAGAEDEADGEREAPPRGGAAPPGGTPLRHCPGARVPPALSAVVMKALSLAPEDRYQSVPELQAEIEAYQGGYATSAEEAGALRQFWLFMTRHKIEFVLTFAAVLILLAVVIGFVMKVEREKDRAVRNEETAMSLLTRFRTEHAEKERISRQAAPEFVPKAQRLMEMSKWEEASQAVGIALGLDEDLPEAWRLKGRLHLGSQELPAAVKAFLKCGDADRQGLLKIAKKYLVLAAVDGGWLSANHRLALALEVERAGDYAVAARLFKSGDDAGAAVESRLKAVREALAQANPRQKDLRFVYQIEEREIILDASSNRELTDIGPLAGLPLTYLGLDGTNVSDIGPLEGMPLKWLNLWGAKVSDLSALKDMPLTELFLARTEVSDVSVLRGMPLSVLSLSGTKVTDVSVLRDARLTRLALEDVNVTDLSPLRGMPLTSLNLSWSKVVDLSALKGAPLTELLLAGVNLTDIGPLAGMPLTDLDLSHTKVSDLAPLKGMLLRDLDLSGAAVSDISPLKGMPLTILVLAQTRVVDVNALRGMPLEELQLHGCERLHDLSPLTECRKLEKLSIPVHVKDVECLRKLDGLKRLCRGWDEWSQTAEEFWQEHDAGKARR